MTFQEQTTLKKKLLTTLKCLQKGNAYKEVGIIISDLILINYNNKPRHGIQTAQATRQRKKTADIPILFIDGEQSEIDKIQYLGQAINSKQIDTYIQKTRNTSH